MVLLERLAGIAAGGMLDHTADVEDIADDSHCSSDSEEPESSEKPGTAAAIEQP